MKNKCKHKSPSLLIDAKYFGAVRWYWCSSCGATRLDKVSNLHKVNTLIGNYEWANGKWKSPTIAIT